MKDTEIQKVFEESFVKGTCFNSLSEALGDKTPFQINVARAMMAVSIAGAWNGFLAGFDLGRRVKKVE